MPVNAILQGQGYTKPETDALLATKQDNLTFDTAPTASSTNPVTSGGIATALDGKLPSPENAGAVGQVLTRTATGSVWQTQSSGGDIVAAASNSYAVTLYANSWSNQQQTITTPSGAEITNTSDGILGLAASATEAQVKAFQLAKIIVVSQSSSGIVVKAYGNVPTINLPCELMLFMKANYYTQNYIDTHMAPLDTPTFIGTPKAPTATAGTNTTQIATTAFVEQAKNIVAHLQTTNVADHTYKVGEHFCYAGNLYRVTTPVSAGTTLIANTNCVKTTVGEGLVSTRTVTQTTTATGRINTSLQTANSIILSAIANGYFCSVYVNNDVQGVEIRDLSGNPVDSQTVTVTLVVLYII